MILCIGLTFLLYKKKKELCGQEINSRKERADKSHAVTDGTPPPSFISPFTITNGFLIPQVHYAVTDEFLVRFHPFATTLNIIITCHSFIIMSNSINKLLGLVTGRLLVELSIDNEIHSRSNILK